jgi:hypothetical protein
VLTMPRYKLNMSQKRRQANNFSVAPSHKGPIQRDSGKSDA